MEHLLLKKHLESLLGNFKLKIIDSPMKGEHQAKSLVLLSYLVDFFYNNYFRTLLLIFFTIIILINNFIFLNNNFIQIFFCFSLYFGIIF